MHGRSERLEELQAALARLKEEEKGLRAETDAAEEAYRQALG